MSELAAGVSGASVSSAGVSGVSGISGVGVSGVGVSGISGVGVKHHLPNKLMSDPTNPDCHFHAMRMEN